MSKAAGMSVNFSFFTKSCRIFALVFNLLLIADLALALENVDLKILSAFKSLNSQAVPNLSETPTARKGVVLIFLSAKCPCSNNHIQEIKTLAQEYPTFQFLAIHSNTDESEALAEPYFKALNLDFAVLNDPDAKIADLLKAFKTPHSFVISNSGQILYKGGVSNSSNPAKADQHLLKEALEDTLNGKPVRTPEGRTLGCMITRKSQDASIWK